MKIQGTAFKYGDNVDTDVIIPARYLNTPDAKELATHCMEDIDPQFASKVQRGDAEGYLGQRRHRPDFAGRLH